MMRRPRIQVQPVPWSLGLDSDLAAWRQIDSMFMSYDVNYARLANHVITPTERLEIILSYEIFRVRASDLALFISKCPPEALKDNFKLIVNSIFVNGDGGQAWDLRNLRKRDFPLEAAAVLRLLAPDGPLITLALRLMDDHNFKLDFPFEGLPLQLQRRLKEMDVPSFFVNKIANTQQLGGNGRNLTTLLLNPFEYYLFCFASVNMIGLTSGRPGDYLNGWAAMQDTLYTNVLEEYLMYYFPCHGGGVPIHNFNYNVNDGREPVFMANSLLRQQQHPKSNIGVPSSFEHSEGNLPKLFKPSVLQEQTGGVAPREKLFLTTHPSAYKEIWRSETILHVFMELWMCGYHNSLDKVDNFSASSPMMYGGLPSVEVVKSVRMLVRHLHCFVNCVNSHAMHPMEEIRRTSIPVFQRRLYSFLRYLFHHWPLDNSFRIVYETWLSYIQPWRYVTLDRSGLSRGNLGREGNDPTVVIDRRWYCFIMDNILFYSKLLSQILTRLERVDLSATKNALMFYRVAKVYTSQDGLKVMLKEIEINVQAYEKQLAAAGASASALQANIHSTRTRSMLYTTSSIGRDQGAFGSGRQSSLGITSVTVPQPSPSTHLPEHYIAGTSANAAKMSHLRQVMKDFENSDFVYEPIFSEENIRKIEVLMSAAGKARDILFEAAEKNANKDTSKLAAIKNWFTLNVFEYRDEAMVSLNAAERRKAGHQLDYARTSFATFFDIQIPEPPHQYSLGGLSYLDDLSSRFDSEVLSSKEIEAAVGSGSKLKLRPGVLVEPEPGPPLKNPDTDLIRSDECRCLVRFWFFISSFLNHVFEDKIDEIYFSPTWRGRYLRAVLAEPTEYIFAYKKPGPLPRRIVKRVRYLPPRVHLRFLASYTCLGWIFAIIVAATVLDLTVIETAAVLLLLYCIYLTFRATSEPFNKLGELQHFKMLFYPPENQNNNPESVEEPHHWFYTSTPRQGRPSSAVTQSFVAEDDMTILRRSLIED